MPVPGAAESNPVNKITTKKVIAVLISASLGLLVKQKAQALSFHDGKIQTNEDDTKNNERNDKRNEVIIHISPPVIQIA